MSLADLCGWRPLNSFPTEVQHAVAPKIEALDEYPLLKRGESSAGKRFTFFEFEKQVLGRWLPLTNQNIGSCVGHGGFNCLWRRILLEVAKLGDREKFVTPYLPYSYAASRMHGTKEYGIRWGGSPDGSMGYLYAEAAAKYGFIEQTQEMAQPITKTRGIEYLDYPGKTDAQWATSPFLPNDLVNIGTKHLFKRVYKVTSYEQARDALVLNHDPLTLAWMFNLHPSGSADGKAWAKPGRMIGGHQVCILGVDDDAQRPGLFLANSWSPGWIKQSDGPDGAAWIEAEYFDRLVKDNDTECYAFSDSDGYDEDGSPILKV